MPRRSAGPASSGPAGPAADGPAESVRVAWERGSRTYGDVTYDRSAGQAPSAPSRVMAGDGAASATSQPSRSSVLDVVDRVIVDPDRAQVEPAFVQAARVRAVGVRAPQTPGMLRVRALGERGWR